MLSPVINLGITVVVVLLCIWGAQVFMNGVLHWYPVGMPRMVVNVLITLLVVSRRYP